MLDAGQDGATIVTLAAVKERRRGYDSTLNVQRSTFNIQRRGCGQGQELKKRHGHYVQLRQVRPEHCDR